MVCDIRRPLLWDVCGQIWLLGACGLKEAGGAEGAISEDCSPAAPSSAWVPWDKMVTSVLQEGQGCLKGIETDIWYSPLEEDLAPCIQGCAHDLTGTFQQEEAPPKYCLQMSRGLLHLRSKSGCACLC